MPASVESASASAASDGAVTASAGRSEDELAPDALKIIKPTTRIASAIRPHRLMSELLSRHPPLLEQRQFWQDKDLREVRSFVGAVSPLQV
jgi:hypothetical protein